MSLLINTYFCKELIWQQFPTKLSNKKTHQPFRCIVAPLRLREPSIGMFQFLRSCNSKGIWSNQNQLTSLSGCCQAKCSSFSGLDERLGVFDRGDNSWLLQFIALNTFVISRKVRFCDFAKGSTMFLLHNIRVR